MSRSLKEKIITLLEERRLEELAELIYNQRSAIRYLNRLLYEPEGLLRWRAIEGMGAVADRLAGEDPEAVRVILRNLLWSINDESGGIGWSAPECIGEIIYRRPAEFAEFAPVILFGYVDEPVLRRGVAWAAGRIALVLPGLVKDALPHLIAFLDDKDPVVRGYTLRFLEMVGERPDFERYSFLLGDLSPVPVYVNGQLERTTVADLAAACLDTDKSTPIK